MNKARLGLFLTLAFLGLSLMAVLGWNRTPLRAMPAQLLTPESYLPLAMRQATPTPTPTATPTPTPTSTPTVVYQDGNYQADVGCGKQGRIFFTVKKGSSRASDASLFFQAECWCQTAIYEFPSSTSIEDGYFRFQVKDGDDLVARLTCDHVSYTEASCTAVMGGMPAGCDTVTGNATRLD